MAKKPKVRAERVEIVYDNDHWSLLHELRREAIEIMRCLRDSEIDSIIYGSIARGDVSSQSDVDVFIPDPPSSFIIEAVLEKTSFPVSDRILVQATPSYAVKAYIEIGERRSVSFPLIKLRGVEREFYKFGGELPLHALGSDRRVPGVDKRLMLIEPTPKGHVESNVVGREDHIASLLGIDANVVLDRVHALTRREEVGRTGVFIKRELSPDDSFEALLKEIADKNPAVRRRIRMLEK